MFPTSSRDVATYTTFDDLVASYRMPPPGPEYFRAQRQLWLTPRSDRVRQTTSLSTSAAHKKLVEVLQAPDAVYSSSSWKNGIEKVWKGLSKGESLKNRLPLALAIKVLQASWVRDETWPAGTQAPVPDDELPDDLSLEPLLLERIDTPSIHLRSCSTLQTSPDNPVGAI